MLLSSAATSFFIPTMRPTFLCSNKTTSYRGKGRCYATMVHPKQYIETPRKDPHLMLESEKMKKINGVSDTSGERLSSDGRVFRMNLSIKSHELGPDGKASIVSFVKHIQEVAVQHCMSFGILAGGYCITPEMEKRSLVWVLRRLQIDVDSYPSWGDVIQIDTWCYALSDKGIFRDYLIRDARTGEILIRITSQNVMMNMETRRLSRLVPEITKEVEGILIDSEPLTDINRTKLRQLDVNGESHARRGLSPSWTDIDVNLHVSHSKYVDWIFQSIPLPILENHELSSIVLEFRSECQLGAAVESLTAPAVTINGAGVGSTDKKGVELNHLLRFEEGESITRGRTLWKPRGDGKTINIATCEGMQRLKQR